MKLNRKQLRRLIESTILEQEKMEPDGGGAQSDEELVAAAAAEKEIYRQLDDLEALCGKPGTKEEEVKAAKLATRAFYHENKEKWGPGSAQDKAIRDRWYEVILGPCKKESEKE